MRLLVVKTSSLGDVIHTLAALSDARAALPRLEVDWLVEEAYREVPAWHPAVREVIPCALRRWRRTPLRSWFGPEWRALRTRLRSTPYDLVLDAQGLLKSALLALPARGPLAGRGFGSVRERAAALFYRYRLPVPADWPEVEQLRELFAQALGYARPKTPAEFGIDSARFAWNPGVPATGPYAVLLHGAGWPTKLWPEAHWVELAQALRTRGIAVKLPWGSPGEEARAQRIAQAAGGEVLPRLGVGELARVIAPARFCVGLDTGLTHLSVAIGTRTATLYGPSVPVFAGVAHGELLNLCSTGATTVDTRRPTTVPVQRVLQALEPWLGADALRPRSAGR